MCVFGGGGGGPWDNAQVTTLHSLGVGGYTDQGQTWLEQTVKTVISP